MIRIAIIDDHPTTAQGLGAMLSAEDDFEIIGTAGTYDDAIELLERHLPDIALVDVQLHGHPSGFNILRDMAGKGPAILLLSSFDYPGFHRQAIELGARGYLAKTASLSDIVCAIRSVAVGGTAFTAAAIRDGRMAPRRPSPRELEVIRLLAIGRSNDEIGASLGLSERTVESHLRRLYGRYEVFTRTELVIRAAGQGWIDLPVTP